MKVHANAPLGPKGRLTMVLRVVEQGWSLTQAAEAAGVSERTARKWVARERSEGRAGLVDRSSAPRRVANRTGEQRVAAIAALRRLRMTGAEIAEVLVMPLSTVSGILTRIGMGKLGRLGQEPAVRYERDRPGELIHIDVKKLGRIGQEGHRIHGDRRRRSRGIGWEFVHVCVDDCTRLAYVEVLDDERKETVTVFLRRAVAWFADQGVIIERLMTDNGPGYRSKLHQRACQALSIRHLFTRPYRPRTNGKAERFIRTLLEGWAYRRAYATSHQRRAALTGFLHHYNNQRPHRSLGRKTPAQRLAERNKTAAAYI